jgi:hypothetical protein
MSDIMLYGHMIRMNSGAGDLGRREHEHPALARVGPALVGHDARLEPQRRPSNR